MSIPNIRESLQNPIYAFSDVDRLAGVSRGTAKRWLKGYAPYPPVTLALHGRAMTGFLDLIDVTAVGKLKTYGFSLPLIREIVANAQNLLGIDRPLASAQFQVGGRDIFVGAGDSLAEASRRWGPSAWHEVLAPFLKSLDYMDDLAAVWWPLGRDNYVRVSPDYGFGFPVIAPNGVRTEILRERFLAHDPISIIAEDFRMDPPLVEAALRFELRDAVL